MTRAQEGREQPPPEQQPGSVFCYDNGANYTLGAIVQRVTGHTLLSYLRPRLVVQLVFDETPHRLALEVDRTSLQASGRWLTVPLHRPG